MATTYKQLVLNEKQAILTKAIKQLTNGFLATEEISAIVNWEWQDKNSNAVISQLTPQPQITIHRNVEAFAKAATLVQDGIVHSWAGENTQRQEGNWIIGDGEFGQIDTIDFSDNGNWIQSHKKPILPNFELDKVNVIVKKLVDTNTFDDRNEYSESWEIHIFKK